MGTNTVEIRFTAKDFTRGTIRGLNKSFGMLGAGVKGVTNQLFSLKGLLATVGIGAVGKSFLDAASTTEGFQTRLSVLLGSVEEGNRLFQDMAEYAGKVPFQYEEIMASATQLSGIMKGGVDEINEWMPLIGDLAATSGLSIQVTTEQISRMLSAGAASADLFRERGITAMLGFTAGVSYSVEDTRRILMEAWNAPTSKFRDATKKLATNWAGTMSMIQDKWFAFRTRFMDAGVMDYAKAIATTIDQYLGDALQASKDDVGVWANYVIDGLRSVMDGISALVDVVHGVRVAWRGLLVAFAFVAEQIVRLVYNIADGFVVLANLIPGIDIGPLTTMSGLLETMRGRTADLVGEFNALALAPLPSVAIEDFAGVVESNFERIKTAKEDLGPIIPPPKQEDQDLLREALQQRYDIVGESLRSEQSLLREKYQQDLIDLEDQYIVLELSDQAYLERKLALTERFNEAIKNSNKQTATEFSRVWSSTITTFSKGIGDAFASAVIDQKNLAEAMRVAMKSVAKQVISSLIQIGVQLAIQRVAGNAGVAATTAAVSASASTIAAAAAPAAAMTSLMSFGANSAPAVSGMSTAMAAAKSLAILGQAHDGLDYVPKTGTYLLERGEMVQSKGNAEAIRSGAGRSVSIANLNLHFFENATNADAMLAMTEEDFRRVVEERVLPAMDALKEDGIGLESLERES